MKTYIGIRDLDRDRTDVTVDGEPLDLRLDLAFHSPNGFEWGYRGDGAAQLAIALLADAVGDELALEYAELFKVRVVASLGGEWRLPIVAVFEWIDNAARVRKSSLRTVTA